MGRRRRRIFKWLSFFVTLLLLVYIGQLFCFRYMNHDQRRIDGFYMEKKNSLDVVFLGASELFSDFSSAQAYDEFGFTSYPYAVRSNPITLWKYELQEIIDNQHPKLIVVETNGALYSSNIMLDPTTVHRIADNIPFSFNKISMIRDYGSDEKLSYFFPILKYYNNWEWPKSMVKGIRNKLLLYRQGTSFLKGIQMWTEDYTPKDLIDTGGDQSEKALDPVAEEALVDFLTYCHDNNIENIVFARYPHCITKEEDNYVRFERNNTAARIIKENGFDYIDLDSYKEDIGLDPKTDFYNGEHMNAYGMKKTTTWFGRYLVEQYHLEPKEQTKHNKEQWNMSARYMKAFYQYYDKLKEKYKNSKTEIYENAMVMKRLKKMLTEE